jgi:hypothetical protein
VAVAMLALALTPARAAAQQAYPASPNGTASSPYSASPYPNQYPQPSAQNGYGQPQYQQPQYSQPQVAQPQYSGPQQPYSDQQPYAQQPYAASPYPQPDLNQPAAPVQALSAQDLEQLLAPIALYPDALLAQILTASTYPAQVAVADQWLGQMRAQGYGSPDQIAAGAQEQTSWDPSIKALTAFPDVLDMMNHNLEWTTNLGNAYYNQPQDVMQTVQVLRDRAEQAGNLQTTPQEDVTNDQGYVQLAPANPEVVYVPTYDPWDVYGQPIAPYPGFSFFGALGNFFGAAPIQYGLSFGLAAFDRMPFGWLAWGLDWLGHAILFDHAGYFTHSASVADWGLPRGGPRAYNGWGGNGHTRDGPYMSNGERQSYNQRDTNQRGGWSNNRGPGQSLVRPAERFPEPGRLDYSNRMSQPSYGYTRPALPAQSYDRPAQQNNARVAPQQSYGYRPQTYPNRAQTYSGQNYAGRPQTFSNPGSGYGYTNRPANNYSGQGYAARPSFAYANPQSTYRAPQSNSRAFSSRSYQSYGNTMARNERSGGFRPFSGGKEPKSFGSERAPKSSYKAPKGFGGGHQSFGGGHVSAPKMSHSGGGGSRRR